ncbi:MAG: adenylate/guanylate cyclase domain-containing protein [Chloroflexota bacterium]
MRCTACGTENPPHARFCLECGTPLARRCSSCGTALPDTARFCLECGHPVATAVPTPLPAPTAPPTPQTYTPRHLAEKILAGRDALQGERKQVTVLFADVVGSTELIGDRDPEDAQRLLDGVVQCMMAAVHRYEGTVSRLMGDGLMAMFGAPVAHEDHAIRACYAALAMLEASRAYAERARRTDGANIQIRVGLNSGEVIVRLISDDLHMDYTAMGQTVHLASRMEGLASAGTALLSPATRSLAEGFVEVRPLGPMSVKGLAHPVDVYELVGAGAARTRLQASVARGLTPFVGRQDERAAIDRALARARTGQGQLVALVAEAGVGKSRLIWETVQTARVEGWNDLQAGAVSYGQTTAWLPVADLLRRYFQIESRDDHAAIREKVAAAVQALDPALTPIVPALLALLDLPVDDAAWVALDPRQRRTATLDALRRLLLRESQKQPLLLVFEDLHWIDAETQAFLDGLVEALPTARILLLVNYRPEYTHTWGNPSTYTQLRVEPLGQVSAERMLDVLLGDDSTVRPLKALLIARTEGNPFFLEESVRALRETGALTGEPGALRLGRTVEEIRVPATVQAVLAARIDRLPAEEKRLLQTAAVLGKDVPFTLLEAIADTPHTELQSLLARLQAAELLYPVSLFPTHGLTFKHALTHDVAYGSLLQERRKSLHARIVQAIERAYSERLEEHVERLARHALAAEDWNGALRSCEQAGDKMNARAAYREAADYFERALEAFERLDNKDDRITEAIDLRLKLRNVVFSLGDFRGGLAHLVEAERLAESVGDRRRLAAISTHLGSSLVNLGQTQQAFRAVERAFVIADELGDDALKIGATYVLGGNLRFAGAFRECADFLRRNLGAVGGNRRFQTFGQVGLAFVVTRGPLTVSLAELGELDDAIAVGAEAVQVAEEAEHPYSMAYAHDNVGYPHLVRGDLAGAIRHYERAVHLAQRQDNGAYLAIAGTKLGYAYVLSGRVGGGLSLVRRGADRFESAGHIAHLAQAQTYLAHALLLTGAVEQALAVAQQALTVAQATEQPPRQAGALRVLGEIAACREPLDADLAERHFHEALTLAEQLEMRPLQAHCHLGLGKLYRRTSRPDEASSELTIAVTMLRDMGMTFWLPDAEAELAASAG